MAGDLSVYGLVTGVDWSSVVNSIIAIEHKRVELVENKKEVYEEKLSAWKELEEKLLSLMDISEDLSEESGFSIYKSSLASSSSEDPSSILEVSVGSNAYPGSHTIRVISLADQEIIESRSFSDTTSSLGISGDIIINGRTIHIYSSDALSDIAGSINAADAGIRASILKAPLGYRLVITSEDPGSYKISISNGSSNNILSELGLSTENEVISHRVSGGVRSAYFSSSQEAIGNILNLSSPPSGTVEVAGVQVFIDLSVDSLSDIASKINSAWQSAGHSGDIASVETTENGYYLKLLTTNLKDGSNVLDVLDIMRYAQDSVPKVMETSNPMTSGGNPVTESTLITSIDTETGGPRVGETITISGKDGDGNPVNATFTIGSGSTVGDLIDAVEGAFSGEVVGSVTEDGKLRFEVSIPGNTMVEVNIFANNEQGGALDFGDVVVIQEGRDIVVSPGSSALVEIDGELIEEDSNSISDAIPGVTLNLKASDPETEIRLEVSRDIDAVASKIEDFINKVNDVIEFINSQYDYHEGDKSSPPLMGDGTVFMLMQDMRDKLYSVVDGLPDGKNSLASIGINMNNDGTLSVDEEKLRDSLSGDYQGTISVFTGADGSSPGVAARLHEFLKQVTGPYSNGYVETHIEEIQSDISRLEERIEDMEDSLERERDMLISRFNALEVYMSKMRALQSWLSHQLGGVSSISFLG